MKNLKIYVAMMPFMVMTASLTMIAMFNLPELAFPVVIVTIFLLLCCYMLLRLMP